MKVKMIRTVGGFGGHTQQQFCVIEISGKTVPAGGTKMPDDTPVSDWDVVVEAPAETPSEDE